MTYKFSKTKRVEFAKQMQEIEQFCIDNNISKSKNSDSYYFEIEGKLYRVSNHTVSKSNSGCYDWQGVQVRESYHQHNNYDVEITAGKTRLIEIYNAVKAGKKLDKRGKELVIC